MAEVESVTLLCLMLLLASTAARASRSESEILAEVKSGLDPGGEILVSWIAGGDPCSGSFLGVACDAQGRVTNVSLQGKGLKGSIPQAIGQLPSLTGLYLHYNSLSGSIPSALAALTGLTDVYLNVNKLSGTIPSQLGESLRNIQALQLCCNDLSGRIPDSLGHLGLLNLLALQHNRLEGRIPASLGQLTSLKHLDLSFNSLSGPIPAALSNLAQITTLDVRSNSLSGDVPSGLRTLEEGFIYSNNSGLCGQGFANLPSCSTTSTTSNTGTSLHRPQPVVGGSALSPAAEPPLSSSIPPRNLVQPQAKSDSVATAKGSQHSSSGSSRISSVAVIGGVVAVTSGVLLAGLLSFVWFRRHKQRISSTTSSPLEAPGRNKQQLAIVDFTSSEQKQQDYDPALTGKASNLHLAMQSINAPKSLVGSSMRSFQYRLDELEMATNYFSDKYLLARKSSVSIYRAVVRDGSTVVIKDYSKTRFVGGEQEFEAALSSLTQLKHDNLVKLRGFCCVKGGLQCYLVYDYVPNGTLFEHLHGGTASRLDWGTRVHIAHGVAKGLDYLHRNGEQLTIWASNVLLDDNYNALVSSWGLGKLLADEVVYANIKTSAMLGYLAPEYATLGHLNHKSDVYAFGVLLLELLTGRKPLFHADGSNLSVTSLVTVVRPLFESGQLNSIIDPTMSSTASSKFSPTAAGVMGIGSIALACVATDPEQRPSMAQLVQRLYEIETESLAESGIDAGFSSSGEEYPSRQQAAYAEMMLDYGR